MIADHLNKLIKTHRLLTEPDAASLTALQQSASRLAELADEQGTKIAADLMERCTIRPGQIEITFNPQSLAAFLSIDEIKIDECALTFTASFQLRRRGIETKIVSTISISEPDQKLIALLAKAHRWREEILSGILMHQISAQEGRGEDYVRARIELAFLSPTIQQRILDGTQAPELTLVRLVKGNIPIDWTEQERRLL